MGGGWGGIKATGRAVGEVTVQTVHLSLTKSHSICSNCCCRRNRQETRRRCNFTRLCSQPFSGQLSFGAHAREHGRAPGWNKPIRPTIDGKVIGRARPITDTLPSRQPPTGAHTPSSHLHHFFPPFFPFFLPSFNSIPPTISKPAKGASKGRWIGRQVKVNSQQLIFHGY